MIVNACQRNYYIFFHEKPLFNKSKRHTSAIALAKKERLFEFSA